ncbi:SH3 domain-containing kinase-binding protein 1 isoform X2 [Thalassophryne amazonica]|uniref:SH3 domain-containing kinase-binding protein 1 isoform X2 n=1 Tax=Thalassophryne amazonica TaxID=390379 RepID=UPI0014714C9D|nr:SH3 domain-containing kinase-binding protein 1 isoform X2 [Thalassophryne amazonica]
MLLYLTSDANKTGYSSALIPDTEEFRSIVSDMERLNERAPDERLQAQLHTLVTLEMELQRTDTKNQSEMLNSVSSTQQENPEEPKANSSDLSGRLTENKVGEDLLPKVLSALLHQMPLPDLKSKNRPSVTSDRQSPPNLEELQTELRELKNQFEQMKSQHNKEIKLLMNELDEEKRIRLTLQMEIQRMKKHMSK